MPQRTHLEGDTGQDEFPVWSPDGQRIAFSSTPAAGNSNVAVYWQAANGTGSAELLAESPGQLFPGSFLPDATGILVHGDVSGNNQNDDILIVGLTDGGAAKPVLQTTFGEQNPSLSPDGRWLTYASDESGSEEIYVRPFPDVDAGRWQVSTGGGVQPLWAGSGQELFYRNGDAVIAVSVETEPSFTQGNPEVMFEGDYLLGPGGRTYDVSPDGEHFLMIRPVDDRSATSKIVIVQNWFEELERLVPTQ